MEATAKHDFNIAEKQKLLQNYTAVLHAMHDLVFVLDNNRVFTDIFQPDSSHLYIPPEAFLHKKITDIDFPAEIITAIQAKLDKTEASGQTENIDYSLPMPGGKHHYNANISGIFADKNVLQGFVLVVRDVTDQVKQQDNFKAIVERYNLAEKSARFGAWEFDYIADNFYWNEGMEAIFECKITNSQQYRDLWKKILDPIQYESLISDFYPKQKIAADFTAEYVLNIFGETKYVEVFATFKNNPYTGVPEKATGIVLDITGKKKTEIELLKSEEQFRIVAENIIDMVVVLSPDSRRLYVSPSSYNLTGYHPRELLEGHPQQVLFYEPVDREVAWAAISAMAQGDGPGIAQFNFRHKNGSKITMEGVPKAIRDAEGNISSYLISLRDVTKQAEAEKAMRKSEEQYRLLADNITDLVVLLSPELQRLYVSPSCLPLTGYTQDEFLNGTIKDLIHPEDAAYFFNTLKNTIYRNTQKIIASYRIKHKQGYWVYVESVLKGIRNNKGELVNILSTSRDITKQQETETAKRKSDDLYRMLADNISDMLILYNTDYSRSYVSPSSINVTGYSPEEIFAMEPLAVIHPDDKNTLKNTITDNVYKGFENFTAEFRLLHKNGDWRYCSSFFTVIRNANGLPVNVLSTVKDITAEKKARIALKENEEKYRSLVEASNDIILIMDENGKYLFGNEIACKKINTTIEELTAGTIYTFFDKDTGDRYVNKVKQVLTTGQNITFEGPIVAAGQKLWLRNTLQPIYDSVSNVYAVMLCLVDITDLKSYAEKLLAQNKELKKIAQLQSHIVRAPLANMEGLINLLDESNFTNENREYITLLKESALQLDAIVKEIVEKAIKVKQE